MAVSGRRIDNAIRQRIIQWLRDGRSLNETAKRFDVSRQFVKNVKKTAKEVGILKPRMPDDEAEHAP